MAEPFVPSFDRGPLVDHETFRILLRAREFMADQFDRPLTLNETADEAGFSPFYFHRTFQRAFGETPLEFLTRLRLERAKRLLAKSPLSVLEICVEVGYGSPSSFSAWFERHVGERPTQFRRVYSLPDRWFLRHIPGCFAYQSGIALNR